MKRIPLALIIMMTIVGCSLPRSGQPAATSGRAISSSTVAVLLYRMNLTSVPISVHGASLRSVIADARDLASQGGGIVTAYALNDAATLSRVTGLTITRDELMPAGLAEPINAGAEVISLIRGNVRIFIPSIMIHETAVGSLRIQPGDTIMSIPATTYLAIGVPASGDADETPSTQVAAYMRLNQPHRVTLTSDYFQERQLTLRTVRKVGTLVDFFNWGENDNLNEVDLRFDQSQLFPNAVVVHRDSDSGFRDISILPFSTEFLPSNVLTSRRNVGSNEFDSNSLGLSTFLNLPIMDNDVIEITRLERIPVVASGLSLPLPPRPGASSVGANRPGSCGQDRSFAVSIGDMKSWWGHW